MLSYRHRHEASLSPRRSQPSEPPSPSAVSFFSPSTQSRSSLPPHNRVLPPLAVLTRLTQSRFFSGRPSLAIVPLSHVPRASSQLLHLPSLPSLDRINDTYEFNRP
ncbi:hypothetical protein RIF29_20812 [Crotalaria pallida]|uniref:Uncharacterized protein n=1 Tax=Crotalaria pallida TaxID=3830 RepID=A0AAN9F6B0_CROPI